jgi:5-methylcytosine-specific restriction endonuclease McrA
VRKIFLEKIQTNTRCRFCQQAPATDAAHLIRRSYSTRLITEPRNIVPACRRCHDIFDNHRSRWGELRYLKALVQEIKSLDEGYFNKNFIDLYP